VRGLLAEPTRACAARQFREALGAPRYPLRLPGNSPPRADRGLDGRTRELLRAIRIEKTMIAIILMLIVASRRSTGRHACDGGHHKRTDIAILRTLVPRRAA